jgi:hypothetical protein
VEEKEGKERGRIWGRGRAGLGLIRERNPDTVVNSTRSHKVEK